MKDVNCNICGVLVKDIEKNINDRYVKCETCKLNKCETCNTLFEGKIKKGRKVVCVSCKRKVVHKQDKNKITTILQLSTRTVAKILKRANKKCSLCGWNESTCDIHHIIEKKDGGSDDMENLICVCPNCHRIIHNENKYSFELLVEKSLVNTFENWKNFYAISNC